MHVIAVISRKGGAGKTTVAVNLALEAHSQGYRTLLVDSDPQRSAAHALRGRVGAGPSVSEASAGKLHQAGISARRDGFDFVIVDTPAWPDADVTQAANMADFCLIACRPTFLDVAAVLQSADMMKRLDRRAGVVMTQTPPGRSGSQTSQVRRAVEALELTGLPLLGVVGARVACQRSLAQGLSASEAGSSEAGAEFAGLLRAVKDTVTAPRTGFSGRRRLEV